MENSVEVQRREVLEFDLGVRVYPPAASGGYWRVRWDEQRRHRDTSARTKADAIAKATELGSVWVAVLPLIWARPEAPIL